MIFQALSGGSPRAESAAPESAAPESAVTAADPSAVRGDGPGPSAAGSRTGGGSKGLRGLWLPILSVVVIVVVVGAGLAIYGFPSHKSSSAGPNAVVLFEKDVWYSLPPQQFADAAFNINTSGVVVGTFDILYWMQSYLMTPPELQDLALKGNIDGFSWFGGNIANGTATHFELNVTAGSWDLVFFNPSLYNITAMGFWTNMTLTPT